MSPMMRDCQFAHKSASKKPAIGDSEIMGDAIARWDLHQKCSKNGLDNGLVVCTVAATEPRWMIFTCGVGGSRYVGAGGGLDWTGVVCKDEERRPRFKLVVLGRGRRGTGVLTQGRLRIDWPAQEMLGLLLGWDWFVMWVVGKLWLACEFQSLK